MLLEKLMAEKTAERRLTEEEIDHVSGGHSHTSSSVPSQTSETGLTAYCYGPDDN